jgi:O-antigen ligase
MKRVVNYTQEKIAFLIPVFVFAGFFKSSSFDFGRWYLDLTFWLLSFILIVRISKCNYKKIPIRVYNPVIFVILPIAFMILVSILFGDLTSNAYVKIRKFSIILIPTVIVSFWVVKSEADWRYIGNGILALGLYASFYIYFNSIYANRGSISYIFSGTLTALGGLVSAHRFLTELRIKWFYFFAFCICSLGVFVSYARGQQIIYVLVLILIFADYLFSLRIKMLNKVVVILCLLVLSGLIFAGYSIKVGWGENVLWRFKPQYLGEAANLRIVLLEEAFELFKKNPIIPAGIGKYVVEDGTYTFTYPHNMPLEFAAELGLMGLIFYCSIIIGTLFGYSRFRQKKNVKEHLILYFFIFLCSLKQGCIYQDKAFWVWTALGISLLGWRRTQQQIYVGG